MNQRGHRLVILLAMICAVSSDAVTTNWPAITSHQRHFVVDGLPPVEALEIATWAESTLDALAVWSGMAWPEQGVLPMVIAVETRADEERGRAQPVQALTDNGSLRQELLFVNPDLMEEEDALEALCGLLMNRWIFREARRRGIDNFAGPFPAWLAVGAAQNLYPELRVRNLRALKVAERSGFIARADAVFAMQTLPAGRGPEKALTGLVVNWLVDKVGANVLFTGLVNARLNNRPFSMADMRELTGYDSARAFNMAWEVWLAEQDRRVVPGAWSTETADLIRLLELHPQDIGLVTTAMSPSGGRLDYRQLIDARDRPWAQGAARMYAAKLGLMLINKAPALVEAVKPFATFFEAVAGSSRQRKAFSDNELRSIWEDATASFAVYLLSSQ